MFYDTLRVSRKMGRVCINNRELVKSCFTALRRGETVLGYDRNVSRYAIQYEKPIPRKLYLTEDSNERFRYINLAF